jgi:hypothetical protein
MTEPGELAHRDEGQRLVGRLEDLTAFVEQVAPGGLVAGDACVQHQVMVPAGDRDRVELDRAELAEDFEHGVEAPLERPRRREEMPGNEKTARGRGVYLHPEDATQWVLSSTARRSGRSSATFRARTPTRPPSFPVADEVVQLVLELVLHLVARMRVHLGRFAPAD